MLEGLFSQRAKPTSFPTMAVPPVPPQKTKVETKNTNSTLAADQHKAGAVRVYCYRVKEKPHSVVGGDYA
ncbi:MAG: hypothetical protein M0Q44_22015 [Methylobacter sp.]|nr:hypothetical protein [Methylobacter sp.]